MRKIQFLRSQKILRLATADKRGMLHIVPVWYLYNNGNFYVGTNTATKKARNIMGNPNVSFCVDEGIHSPIYGIMGIGLAKIILEKECVTKLAKKILQRYFENLRIKSAQEILSQTDCIIEITPKKIITWEF